jgi:threonine synthase
VSSESTVPPPPPPLPLDLLSTIQSIFASTSVTDAQTLEAIRQVYSDTGFCLCPHSAVGVYAAVRVFSNPPTTPPSRPLVAVLTAHPSKFPEAFTLATGVHPPPLPSNPVDVLYTLPHRFLWLTRESEGREAEGGEQEAETWQDKWVRILKEAISTKEYQA